MSAQHSVERDLGSIAAIVREIGSSLLDVREIADAVSEQSRLRNKIAELEETIKVRNERVSQLMSELITAKASIVNVVSVAKQKRDGLNDPAEDLVLEVARTMFLAKRQRLESEPEAERESAWQAYLIKVAEHENGSVFETMSRAVLKTLGKSIAKAAA